MARANENANAHGLTEPLAPLIEGVFCADQASRVDGSQVVRLMPLRAPEGPAIGERVVQLLPRGDTLGIVHGRGV